MYTVGSHGPAEAVLTQLGVTVRGAAALAPNLTPAVDSMVSLDAPAVPPAPLLAVGPVPPSAAGLGGGLLGGGSPGIAAAVGGTAPVGGTPQFSWDTPAAQTASSHLVDAALPAASAGGGLGTLSAPASVSSLEPPTAFATHTPVCGAGAESVATTSGSSSCGVSVSDRASVGVGGGPVPGLRLVPLGGAGGPALPPQLPLGGAVAFPSGGPSDPPLAPRGGLDDGTDGTSSSGSSEGDAEQPLLFQVRHLAHASMRIVSLGTGGGGWGVAGGGWRVCVWGGGGAAFRRTGGQQGPHPGYPPHIDNVFYVLLLAPPPSSHVLRIVGGGSSNVDPRPRVRL